VVYPEPHRWMDLEVLQGIGWDPACLAGFGTGARLPADWLCV